MNGASHKAVVCIGASWGGLTAIEQVLEELTLPLGAPLCIVLHRPDGSDDGMLVDILARHARFPVREPDDKEPLDSDVAYVAPSGYHLLVDDGHASLSMDERVRWARPSIDVLLDSAAHYLGDAVVAVVLTGANDDGAAGARAVADAGGAVIVQNPASAERPEMPQAALTSVGAAAIVTDLAGIAPAIEAALRTRRAA